MDKRLFGDQTGFWADYNPQQIVLWCHGAPPIKKYDKGLMIGRVYEFYRRSNATRDQYDRMRLAIGYYG